MSAAPAAPASIDTPEFLDLACKFAHESSCEEFIEDEYNTARAALIAHIDAWGQQQREAGQHAGWDSCAMLNQERFRQKDEVITYEQRHAAESEVALAAEKDRADRAEASLARIVAGVEKIDIKAEAGLCQMTIGGIRAFHTDIRMACAALLPAKAEASEPPQDYSMPVVYSDDDAVDLFAAAMKAKMAASRAKGRSGWNDPTLCTADTLRAMMTSHINKGDPVDVGNFCMMLWNRSESTAAPAPTMGEELPDADEFFKAQLSESGMKKYMEGEKISLTAGGWCEMMEDYGRACMALRQPGAGSPSELNPWQQIAVALGVNANEDPRYLLSLIEQAMLAAQQEGGAK